MKLFIARKLGTKGYTAGRLYVDGVFECFTLEDEVREIQGKPVSEWKIHGENAIPKGIYSVIINHSPRFNKPLPLLLDVPGYTGVRIHAGNLAKHTEGCILVGLDDGNAEDSFLGRSREAMNKLQPKIKAALDAGQEVVLTIA